MVQVTISTFIGILTLHWHHSFMCLFLQMKLPFQKASMKCNFCKLTTISLKRFAQTRYKDSLLSKPYELQKSLYTK